MGGWVGQLFSGGDFSSWRRVGGLGAVVVANLAVVVALASGEGYVRRAPERPLAPDFYLIFSQPEPEPEVRANASATVVMPPRPAIVAPERLAQRDESEASTAITAPPDYAPGLKGLVERDPCDDKRERLWRDDCAVQIPGATADARSAAIEEARRTELAGAFGPQCTQAHGCLPMPTKTLGGMNPVPPKTPMSGGAARLGGIHDLIGRLPPPNWYHVDPGFGD